MTLSLIIDQRLLHRSLNWPYLLRCLVACLAPCYQVLVTLCGIQGARRWSVLLHECCIWHATALSAHRISGRTNVSHAEVRQSICQKKRKKLEGMENRVLVVLVFTRLVLWLAFRVAGTSIFRLDFHHSA